MKIDIPFEIGDPILVINYSQHIDCRPFRWDDIPKVGKYIFRTRKDAEQALEDIRKEDEGK